MAHRDGATGAADIVDPQGPASDGAGEDAVTAQGPQDPPADGEHAADDAAPAAADAPETAPEPEHHHGRKPRLPRPSSGRTPAFGLSLAAIRQRSAAADGTAELRRNLADKEAQTNELREALDALRQALDDTTPPKAPDAPAAAAPRRRRPVLLLLAALAAVAVVVAVVLAQTSGGTGTATPPSPTASTTPAVTPSASTTPPASASSAPATGPTASASPSPSGPAVTTTPMRWRGETLLTPPGAAASGPGVDAPGTDVTVAIDADLKHLDVFERVVFSTPQPALTLALPPGSVWATALPQARPVVTDLQVVIDDQAVRPQQRDAGWYALPRSGTTVTRVALRYRVAGTIVDLPPSLPGRRSIGLPTFTGQASLDASAPLHVTVDDPRVQAVTCFSPALGSLPCTKLGDGISADVEPGSSPFVVLLADLGPLG